MTRPLRILGCLAAMTALTAFTACDDDAAGGDTTATDTADTTTDTGDTNTTPGTSAVTGVSVAADCNGVDQTGCTATYQGTGGFTYPMCPPTIGSTDYTCQKCPSGIAGLQGMYRVFGEDENMEPDYSTPDPDTDYAELLFIDGNSWYSVIKDARNGSTAETRGYYMCVDAGQRGEQIFFITTDVSQAGAGGAKVGDVTETDLIASGTDVINLFYYTEAGTAVDTGIFLFYCRIGSMTGGQTCTNTVE
ncbi:MAG: hypothetical protein ACI9MR_004061 [Myxococcota bacterium]|jgi:hypothetical protein